jgi:hypothetical protein
MPLKTVITPAQIEAIRNADPKLPASKLAENLGIPVHLIYYWRAKQSKQPKATKAGKNNPSVHPPAKPQELALAPVIDQAVVSIGVTEPMIDGLWNKLSLAGKARVFTALLSESSAQ